MGKCAGSRVSLSIHLIPREKKLIVIEWIISNIILSQYKKNYKKFPSKRSHEQFKSCGWNLILRSSSNVIIQILTHIYTQHMHIFIGVFTHRLRCSSKYTIRTELASRFVVSMYRQAIPIRNSDWNKKLISCSNVECGNESRETTQNFKHLTFNQHFVIA